MKMRYGYVSNSSSSSFVVFCKDATLDDIYHPAFKIKGKYMTEGIDFFKPDVQTRDWLRNHEDEARCLDLDFMIVYDEFDSEGDDKTDINFNDLNFMKEKVKRGNIISFTADYHPTSCFLDFRDNYLGEQNENS